MPAISLLAGMSLGSFAARVGSVAAPWAAQIGEALPVPEALANDVPLALFGASSVIAAVLALLVLPETLGEKSPETLADALKEMETVHLNKNKRAHQVAVVLGVATGLGASVLTGTVVGAVAESAGAGVGAGIGAAVVTVGSVLLCYGLRYWR